MSLKRMPSVGKSLMSRILALSSATSMTSFPPPGLAADTRDGLCAARGFMIAAVLRRRNECAAGRATAQDGRRS